MLGIRSRVYHCACYRRTLSFLERWNGIGPRDAIYLYTAKVLQFAQVYCVVVRSSQVPFFGCRMLTSLLV